MFYHDRLTRFFIKLPRYSLAPKYFFTKINLKNKNKMGNNIYGLILLLTVSSEVADN